MRGVCVFARVHVCIAPHVQITVGHWFPLLLPSHVALQGNLAHGGGL